MQGKYCIPAYHAHLNTEQHWLLLAGEGGWKPWAGDTGWKERNF